MLEHYYCYHKCHTLDFRFCVGRDNCIICSAIEHISAVHQTPPTIRRPPCFSIRYPRLLSSAVVIVIVACSLVLRGVWILASYLRYVVCYGYGNNKSFLRRILGKRLDSVMPQDVTLHLIKLGQHVLGCFSYQESCQPSS